MVKPLRVLMDSPEFPEGRAWRRERYRANETVFRSGGSGDSVYLILSGSVKVLGDLTLKEECTVRSRLSQLSAGEVFGEFCLFDYTSRSATVTAVEDCEFAVFDKDVLRAYCDAHPVFGYAMLKELMRVVVTRLRKNNEKVLDLVAAGIREDVQRHVTAHDDDAGAP